MTILNLTERIKRLMIFNVKGGVGKTALTLNFALKFGYGVITNDRYSLIDRVCPKNSRVILEEKEPLPEIDKSIPIIYDFGGFPDSRALAAVADSQLVIVPILPYPENIQELFDFLEELICKNPHVIIIVNKSIEKEYLAIKQIINGFYPELPIFPLKRSKAMTRMVNQNKDISAIAVENALNAYHFSSISEQFNNIIEYLYNYERTI